MISLRSVWKIIGQAGGGQPIALAEGESNSPLGVADVVSIRLRDCQQRERNSPQTYLKDAVIAEVDSAVEI